MSEYKRKYIERITEALEQCNEISLLDIILVLLFKCGYGKGRWE